MKVGVVNYGGGNLRSVVNALVSFGIEPQVLESADGFDAVTHLILPGQGEFGDVMSQLEKRGLVDPLREWISSGKPYFGICVGYQILFEGSDEADDVPGLGIIKGRCVRFAEAEGKKIPQMGWNSAVPENVGGRFWKGLGEEPYFYFVHSYYPVVEDPAWAVAKTNYAGEVFVAAVEKGDSIACQFHPEKSQDAGLGLMRNFLGI
ncbi:imidazole glycerol phosphate synthase subunit HisH [Luteolibacter sp. AS25]|uniref:imidazole glycerol phosphate synthase subunit HisH n=1 Tax=Luteolibacter sp. AS25 TaxID=3135776 RepID=UPI00398ABD30